MRCVGAEDALDVLTDFAVNGTTERREGVEGGL